ncbi:hypothetical protein AYJ57_21355 (plasmid) [Salipiger sp. CCB-MM3]|uniref:hypothetical protein n=1 Tax=Salipiger sp. CCB-MM3 TaxID=1792508 RepID=UPI00080AB538|nr:hypothetical protein [Salipiger sp. CCB-MM3]ANT63024.1 hypothetical protein AYJ57_21355 [Salipiger sp. CCB-MM3]
MISWLDETSEKSAYGGMRIQCLSAFILVLSSMATASSADVEVSACLEGAIIFAEPVRASDGGRGAEFSMAVTNHLKVAISALAAEISYRTEGRAVPWAKEGVDRLPIPGGIEPGETRDIRFGTRRGQDWMDPLVADVVIHDASGPNGESLAVQGDTCSTPQMSEEAQALLKAASKCWVVDVGGAAARVSVTVGVTVAQGRVGRDLLLVSAAGGDDLAAETAFQNVRRTLLRCQGDGYAVDDGHYEVTFSPQSLRR